MVQKDDKAEKKAGTVGWLSEQLDTGFNRAATLIADALCEELPPSLGMSEEQQKMRMKYDMQKFFHELKARIENGTMALFSTFAEIAHMHPEFDISTIQKDVETYMNFSAGLMSPENTQKWMEEIHEGKNATEVCHLSDATLEALYQAAKYLYDREQYEKAIGAFSILCILNDKNPAFWVGLGHSESACQHYESALVAYAIMATVDPLDVSCHLYSCECYEALNQLDLAVNALDLALIVIDEVKPEEQLREQVQSYRQTLIQKLQK